MILVSSPMNLITKLNSAPSMLFTPHKTNLNISKLDKPYKFPTNKHLQKPLQ